MVWYIIHFSKIMSMELRSKSSGKSGSGILLLFWEKVDQCLLAPCYGSHLWLIHFFLLPILCVLNIYRTGIRQWEEIYWIQKNLLMWCPVIVILNSFDMVCHFLNATSDDCRLPETQSQILNMKWEFCQQPTFFCNYWKTGPIFLNPLYGVELRLMKKWNDHIWN
jgi:hypothetical protein